MKEIQNAADLQTVVTACVNRTPALDVHTHLYEESFGDLLLRGPEALITYHYLQAETNRVLEDMTPEQWMAVPTAEMITSGNRGVRRTTDNASGMDAPPAVHIVGLGSRAAR